MTPQDRPMQPSPPASNAPMPRWGQAFVWAAAVGAIAPAMLSLWLRPEDAR